MKKFFSVFCSALLIAALCGGEYSRVYASDIRPAGSLAAAEDLAGNGGSVEGAEGTLPGGGESGGAAQGTAPGEGETGGAAQGTASGDGETGGALQGTTPGDGETGGATQGTAPGSGNAGAGGAEIRTPELEAWFREAGDALQRIREERTVMALVYLCDEYPVRTEASRESDTIRTVPSGQLVQIENIIINEELEAWAYVSFYCGEDELRGYIPRAQLACSDEAFLEWELTYGMNTEASVPYTTENSATGYADIDFFPESYRGALIALKQAHPNWTFVPLNTGLDWNTVIANEIIGGKSLIYKNQPAYTKEGLYDSGNWYYASEDILRYYMDPRNGLTEETVFQFEQLTYNPSYHTEAAVEAFLNTTFMNSSAYAPGTSKTYSRIFWEVGSSQGVSPFHLAARVYQEQGSGTSPLISGNYPGYEGYYNYFNVKASGTTNEMIYQNGLSHARAQGWSNAELSIQGGARVVSANYILKGQNTLYLQKFNVNPNSSHALYTHQYMQNIMAPSSEGKITKRLYAGVGALDNTFVFQIPVYENLPAAASPMPASSNNVVLQIPAGYHPEVFLDGISCGVVSRNGRYIVSAPHNAMRSAVVYRYNESGVPVGMYLWTLEYRNGAYTATPQPQMENLLTYHGFSIRITGKSGIRFKTGISADLRNLLTTSGVDGYILKEYGTLIMNKANLGAYPMIKGGQKVASGLSYGIGEGGAMEDKIYETVDGRHRFTSVLVGLPADQYRVEYAFRGYAVLEKNGVQTCVYGPVVGRSIYSLAEQALNMGLYPVGSEADLFLRQLLQDAQ